MKDQNNKKIINSFFEWGILRRQKHVGWILAGVETPDTVAEHCFRAALISYVLAVMEGANPEKCVTMAMIHDLPECRLGDIHKVTARYLSKKQAEKTAFSEQMQDLPKEIAEKWTQLKSEQEERNSREGIVVRDADWLEMALMARENVVNGYKSCQMWIERISASLETESAKKLLEQIDKADPYEWWKGLKPATKKLNSEQRKNLK